MIEAELAWKFIEQVTQYTDYNINIINEDGVIIASRDPKRVGTFHEAAYRIIRGTEDMAVVTGERDYPGVRPGINMVITIDGKREGVVGVSGDPEEIRSVALITKMAMEAMLKYEKQREAFLKRQNRKERFLNLLTHGEIMDPELLRGVAHQLNYSEEIVRIPILCSLEGVEPEPFLQIIKAGSRHSKEDISFVLDENRILIFKTMPGTGREMLSDYKFTVEEYLSEALRWLRRQDQKGKFYIGSFQSSFTQYCYGYQHCLWLEQMVKETSSPVFFYDYAGRYIRMTVPVKELQNMFNVHEALLDEEFRENYLKIMGALMNTNYNLVKAAECLFMHKNTLSYRYNKIKTILNADPIASAGDRFYMETLYYYLKREH